MKRLLLLSVLAVVLGAQPARAFDPTRTYVVPVCSSSSGPQTLVGWGSAGAIFNECASGRGFGGHPEQWVGEVRF